MGWTQIDQATWSREAQFDLFRTYDRPHFAVTSRIDVSHLIGRTGSSYRACLFAIGAGLHGVPALRTRMRGNVVGVHDAIDLSMTVPMAAGGFGYAYVPFNPDYEAFDRISADIIAQTASKGTMSPNTGQRDDVAYLSCLPWLDYTSINNALPGPDDCIPRVSWGKYTPHPDGTTTMAMTIEVHHALVDGENVGRYFTIVQDTINAI